MKNINFINYYNDDEIKIDCYDFKQSSLIKYNHKINLNSMFTKEHYILNRCLYYTVFIGDKNIFINTLLSFNKDYIHDNIIKLKINKIYYPKNNFGPSVVNHYNYFNGNITKDIIYTLNNKIHRLNKPATITYQNNLLSEENYLINGILHRTNGPACIYYKNNEINYKEYWIDGNELHDVKNDIQLRKYLLYRNLK